MELSSNATRIAGVVHATYFIPSESTYLDHRQVRLQNRWEHIAYLICFPRFNLLVVDASRDAAHCWRRP